MLGDEPLFFDGRLKLEDPATRKWPVMAMNSRPGSPSAEVTLVCLNDASFC